MSYLCDDGSVVHRKTVYIQILVGTNTEHGGTIQLLQCDAYQLEKLAVTNNRCRTYAMEALYVGKTVCKRILVDTITEHGGTIE